jgi:NADPH-dependent 2,4-dienoyl-CoA reductase/sulfur reductase-like enzyme/rhodanese-related sulfurtransferase
LDETAEIIMFERGEYISFANCGLPYYVGGTIKKRASLLVQTPKAMHRRFNIEVRTLSEVIRIIPEAKEVEVRNYQTGEVYRESYDHLVLSPGAAPVVPPIPGVDLPGVFTIRNVPDSDAVKAFIENTQPQSAAVIGAGYIGLEMVEVLLQQNVKVHLIEAGTQVMATLDADMASIVQQYLEKQGVDLYLNSLAEALEGEDQVQAVRLAGGKKIAADVVILGAGVRPEVKLAKEAGLTIGSTGGIQVDEYLKTSDPFIYAVGDAIQVKHYVTGQEVLIPLASPANRQGRIVADNIVGRPIPYKGAQGTGIVRVMELVMAVTGANARTLKSQGIEYLTCHTHPFPHATYYPGGRQMAAKLLFAPVTGKVLGAQIVGTEGVDKRIDVLATAIRAGMTVFDLQELELAYAPPFSSAKDPVNMLGYTAGNIINGDVESVDWAEVPDLVAKGAVLLDVRTPREIESGGVEGAVNIPVDDIRDRLEEIPQDKPILVTCQVGIRAYVANRILRQKGYKVYNVSGGYMSYKAFKANRNQ